MAFRKDLVFRQPFPGPGLGIRIIGEVTAEKVENRTGCRLQSTVKKSTNAGSLQESMEQTMDANQYFAALTNMRSVGVMGDERTYDYAVALRAVNND